MTLSRTLATIACRRSMDSGATALQSGRACKESNDEPHELRTMRAVPSSAAESAHRQDGVAAAQPWTRQADAAQTNARAAIRMRWDPDADSSLDPQEAAAFADLALET